MTVGFLGLGRIGRPMATNLVRAGTPLMVWNRSPAAVAELVSAGAVAAAEPSEVFDACEIVILMLLDGAVIDEVLGRASGQLSRLVRQRTVVSRATVAPAYSAGLEADILAAGGSYVEARVSGSRVPAEQGAVVAMAAGEPAAVERVVPVLTTMCSDIAICGPVPNGVTMKLAVNTFLIALVTGLAESFHLGERYGLDLSLLRRVLDGGQMSSPI